jgi:hypothetical protein
MSHDRPVAFPKPSDGNRCQRFPPKVTTLGAFQSNSGQPYVTQWGGAASVEPKSVLYPILLLAILPALWFYSRRHFWFRKP